MICDKNNVEEKTIISNVDLKGKDVLEIGCSNGRYAAFILPLCKTYTGIDINKLAILSAKKEFKSQKANFVCDDFLSHKFENNSFDIIILCLTFHELYSELQGLALLKMVNLLKRNGKIVIIDPTLSKDSFQALYDVVYNNFKYYNHSMDVKHSRWVLTKMQENGIIKLSKETKIYVDFEFENIQEAIDMLIHDEAFEMIEWTKKKTDKLTKMINEFVLTNHLNNNGKILVFDKLKFSIFEKGENIE